MAIGSIVAICLHFILDFTVNICKLTEAQDEVLLNGRYAMEYIKREIRSAEKIIDINLDIFSEIVENYGDNIGFVIMRYDPGVIEKYNYSTYYLKIIRFIDLRPIGRWKNTLRADLLVGTMK